MMQLVGIGICCFGGDWIGRCSVVAWLVYAADVSGVMVEHAVESVRVQEPLIQNALLVECSSA